MATSVASAGVITSLPGGTARAFTGPSRTAGGPIFEDGFVETQVIGGTVYAFTRYYNLNSNGQWDGSGTPFIGLTTTWDISRLLSTLRFNRSWLS